MNYAQAKITLGAIQMGFLLTLSALFVVFDFGSQLDLWAGSLSMPVAWALLIVGFVLVSLPFDLIGGYILPHKFGRTTETLGEWVIGMLRGVGVQGFYFFIQGLILSWIGGWLGPWGAVGWVAISMILLTGLQFYIARLVYGFEWRMESHQGRWVYFFDSQDRAFSGGVCGFPGKESIVIPEYWVQRFPAAVTKMMITRRIGAIQSGSHGRGIGVAYIVNLLAFTGAVFLSPLPLTTLGGLVATVCIFAGFSALAMVGLIPWLSRKGVFEIDRWVYYKRVDIDALRESFDLTHRLQEDMGGKSPVAAVLTSVPTQSMRQAYLQSQAPVKGAWQASRHAIFTSWAGINLLARASYLNQGRPALWVFLPGD
ncbi:hypothetical protein [Pontibacter sp. G13]|uniref:hypothetical protein n=1 Tax=Pontibacter sp. G13 TaxID=3074898 RepID=UPI00288B5761|nr:hypothetical protein [Pontibacter sp. G13]WNJ21109.1 hypothetical protein RJD25_11625 [Pontibacter sp. G13]